MEHTAWREQIGFVEQLTTNLLHERIFRSPLRRELIAELVHLSLLEQKIDEVFAKGTRSTRLEVLGLASELGRCDAGGAEFATQVGSFRAALLAHRALGEDLLEAELTAGGFVAPTT